MRAILLIIELRFPLEHCQKELDAVLGRLPPGSRRVLHAEKTVGILIPPVGILPELKAKLNSALKAFVNWRAFGLSGESICMDRSMDPIEDWMNEFARVSLAIGKGGKTKYVPPPQRWKPRGKPTI